MTLKLKDIPVRVQNTQNIPNIKSGQKYQHEQGFNAIKDGVNKSREDSDRLPKPKWLKIKAQYSETTEAVKQIVKKNKLATVCEQAKCPNLHECWDAGTATIMLMGDVCTRACKFCSVDTGNPKGWLDPKEPENTADAVKLMGLKYVVLTSVDRDDLPDGGAAHYAKTVQEILKYNPNTAVEALTPDFSGQESAIDLLLNSGIKVFAQNIETIKRLTHLVRDPRAGYEQTLKVLSYAKNKSPDILVKTSVMVGLGETDEELIELMDDCKKAGVDIITFGQYLQPTQNHLSVKRYVTPEQFENYRKIGLEKGFLEVVSGPMVRSSYRAEQALLKNNCGL